METKKVSFILNILFSCIYNIGSLLGGSKWEGDNPLSAFVARLVFSPILIVGGGSILGIIFHSRSLWRSLMALVCGAPLLSLGLTFVCVSLFEAIEAYHGWRYDKIKALLKND